MVRRLVSNFFPAKKLDVVVETRRLKDSWAKTLVFLV